MNCIEIPVSCPRCLTTFKKKDKDAHDCIWHLVRENDTLKEKVSL